MRQAQVTVSDWNGPRPREWLNPEELRGVQKGGALMILALGVSMMTRAAAIGPQWQLPPEQMLVVALSAIFGGLSAVVLARRRRRSSVAWQPTVVILWILSVASASAVVRLVGPPSYKPQASTAVLASIAFFVAWWLARALYSAVPDGSGPYVFVSYKSEDATAVRKVVEQLMSRGMRIWFAEYHVLLTNYAQFQRAIDRAIARSGHAVLFTNDAWASSKHVQEEMRQILAWRAADRVVEVRVPAGDSLLTSDLPRNKYGEFTSLEPLTLTDPNDCLELIEDIEAIVGGRAALGPRPLALRALMAAGSFAVHPPTGLGIMVGPFTADRTIFAKVDDGVGGWSWSTDIEINNRQGSVKMLVCLRRKTSIEQVPEGGVEDDRRLYDAYRIHARRWVATGCVRWMPISAKGLHLIRPECAGEVVYGRRISATHFGLTYLTRAQSGPNSWERRYEYALPDPDGWSWMELDLIFWLKLSPTREDEEFRTFCRLTPLFDCIAESLTYRPELWRAAGPNEFVPAEPRPRSGGFPL